MPDATTVSCDVVVIGSGFGGSVAALRLAEKGYRVGVLEYEPVRPVAPRSPAAPEDAPTALRIGDGGGASGGRR